MQQSTAFNLPLTSSLESLKAKEPILKNPICIPKGAHDMPGVLTDLQVTPAFEVPRRRACVTLGLPGG